LHALLPSQANPAAHGDTCELHWWAASQVNTVSSDAAHVAGMHTVPVG